MKDLKFEMKKRTNVTKCLEDILVSDAVESFLKSHNNNTYSNNLLLNDKIKFSSYFTRVWLNYMDNSQLGKILSKKLRIK